MPRARSPCLSEALALSLALAFFPFSLLLFFPFLFLFFSFSLFCLLLPLLFFLLLPDFASCSISYSMYMPSSLRSANLTIIHHGPHIPKMIFLSFPFLFNRIRILIASRVILRLSVRHLSCDLVLFLRQGRMAVSRKVARIHRCLELVQDNYVVSFIENKHKTSFLITGIDDKHKTFPYNECLRRIQGNFPYYRY